MVALPVGQTFDGTSSDSQRKVSMGTIFLVDWLLGTPLSVRVVFSFGLAVAHDWRALVLTVPVGSLRAPSAYSTEAGNQPPSPTPFRARIGCGDRNLRTEDGSAG
jgi:hypothetical protein